MSSSSNSNSYDSTSSKEEKLKQTFIQNTLRDMDLLYDAIKPNSVRVTRLKPESEYWLDPGLMSQNSESKDR